MSSMSLLQPRFCTVGSGTLICAVAWNLLTALRTVIKCFGVADKKQKRKKGQAQAKTNPEDELSVVLYEDETQQQPVDPELPNLQAWRPGRVLQIGDARFSITYNPPTAEKVPSSLTPGLIHICCTAFTAQHEGHLS